MVGMRRELLNRRKIGRQRRRRVRDAVEQADEDDRNEVFFGVSVGCSAITESHVRSASGTGDRPCAPASQLLSTWNPAASAGPGAAPGVTDVTAG